MRYHNLEFDMLLRGIVMTRGDQGATISEMRSDYYGMVGEQWPLYRNSTHQIVKYLTEIDGLIMHKQDSGLCIWYIDDLGINVSGHDSNNNVIETSVVTVSETNQLVQNNSYAIKAPRRRMITSSFVKDAQVVASTSTSSDTLLMHSIENGHLKRNISQVSETDVSPEKRPRILPPNGMRLNEENLDIHNRENGANLMVQQTTSTEIEKSISIPNDLNGCIATNDYIAPIKEHEGKQLQVAFTNRCQINNNKHRFMQIDSEESTISLHEPLFPPHIGLIGDDFMRSAISFELYGADFTSEDDEKFEYCISGLTVREAYHLVLDKQNQFRSKYRYLIVNVGAIDCLLERNIIDIQAEYARLIRAIEMIELIPIITTVPKVFLNHNNKNYTAIFQTLLLLNQFLLSTYTGEYLLVDLYPCFTERKRRFPAIYYHTHPKIITKGNQKLPLFRWTENGRKKILNKIDGFIDALPGVNFA